MDPYAAFKGIPIEKGPSWNPRTNLAAAPGDVSCAVEESSKAASAISRSRLAEGAILFAQPITYYNCVFVLAMSSF